MCKPTCALRKSGGSLSEAQPPPPCDFVFRIAKQKTLQILKCTFSDFCVLSGDFNADKISKALKDIRNGKHQALIASIMNS